MSLYNIGDYDLTALQLEMKHSPEGDSDHPSYSTSAWKWKVAGGETRLGYWQWVHFRLAEERDELERCSPYNLSTHEL